MGVTLVLETAVGKAVAEADLSARFPCQPKGPCLSLLHRGINFLRTLARLVRLRVHFVQQPLPLSQLRVFAWLQTAGTMP